MSIQNLDFITTMLIGYLIYIGKKIKKEGTAIDEESVDEAQSPIGGIRNASYNHKHG